MMLKAIFLKYLQIRLCFLLLLFMTGTFIQAQGPSWLPPDLHDRLTDLKRENRFDEAIVEFAVRYADQNEADYAVFKQAVEENRLEVRVD